MREPPSTSAADAKIGIALSGGGSRAIAFHLGCLRALHQAGILQRVKAISTVSGGSVIGALYALHDGSFEAFESKVRAMLRSGLVGVALRTALTTPEGVKAAICVLSLRLIWLVRLALFWLPRGLRLGRPQRYASRTTILERALNRHLYAGASLTASSRPGMPRWIALATELRTGSAFYFSAAFVGSWRFGSVRPEAFSVAHAVAASAAYPLLLPALDETFEFASKDGTVTQERVSLTDGSVYDNLGLAPFWPDRVADVSLHVEDIDTIIACRAGDGLRLAEADEFFTARMKATFAAMHDRAQNATMKRLFDLQSAGRIARFIVPYLGQSDRNLQAPPGDLVPRDEVISYPTNFSPMPEDWIERLSKRGEQLTLTLLREHHPDLIVDAGA